MINFEAKSEFFSNGLWASCHDDRDVLLMKSCSSLSNQIVGLKPQHEQERTHLFRQHNAKQDSLVRDHQQNLTIRKRHQGHNGSAQNVNRGKKGVGEPGRGPLSHLLLLMSQFATDVNIAKNVTCCFVPIHQANLRGGKKKLARCAVSDGEINPLFFKKLAGFHIIFMSTFARRSGRWFS